MPLHLISFKTCPFVQRAVITLKHKHIDFDVTYIDLADPPDWFLEISPLGKVPVLQVDGETLFESAVINEYLDEITGGDLQPADPLTRARNRAWIEFASDLVGNQYRMRMSTDQAGYQKYRARLADQFLRLEHILGDGPWFDSQQFTLCDTAFAPLFRHDRVAGGKLSVLDPATMPKVCAWADRLLSLPEVRDSVVPDFDELCLAAMEKNGSYSLGRLAA